MKNRVSILPRNILLQIRTLGVFAGLLAFIASSSILSAPSASATTCYTVVNSVIVDGSGCVGNLVIDNSVTGIGQRPDQTGAFEGIAALRSVVVPGSVTHVDYGAFRSSGIESIRFEAGTSPLTINNHSIDYTRSLKLVVLSENTVSIGAQAFYGTQVLKNMYIPASVTSIDVSAFSRSGLTDLIVAGSPRQLFSGNLVQMWNPVSAWVSAPNVSSFQSLNAVTGVTFQSGNGPAPTISNPESNTVFNIRAGEIFSLTMNYYASGNSSTSVSSGTLPPGLQLDSFGHLTGTPTTAGTYNFALSVTDTNSVTTEASNLSMVVAAAFNGTVELTASASTLSWADPSARSYITTNAPSVYPMAEFLSDVDCFNGSADFYSIANSGNTVASDFYLSNPLDAQTSCAGNATIIFRIYALGTQNIDFTTSYLASVTVRIVPTLLQTNSSPTADQLARERELKEAKARQELLENLNQGRLVSWPEFISAGFSIPSDVTSLRVAKDLIGKRSASPDFKLDLSAVQSSIQKEIVVGKLALSQGVVQLFPGELVSAGFLSKDNPNKTRILIALRKLKKSEIDTQERLEAAIANQEALLLAKRDRLKKVLARR